jgi:hypothetical protein
VDSTFYILVEYYMTTFTTNTTGITFKEIQQGDPDFTMTDGIKLVSRASFNISQNCPKEYRMIILECMNNGWIKPVAYIKESDYVWEKLGE